MTKEWENKKDQFKVVDVRKLTGNFLPGILNKAGQLEVGAGAGRLRQATRELVKAYSIGVTVAELDELFSMLVWNGGVGTFASEIGPSSLFGAYQLIKTLEGRGKTREEVVHKLMEKFGEKNPEVSVMHA